MLLCGVLMGCGGLFFAGFLSRMPDGARRAIRHPAFCALRRDGEPTFSSRREGFRGKFGGEVGEGFLLFGCVSDAGRANSRVFRLPLRVRGTRRLAEFFPTERPTAFRHCAAMISFVERGIPPMRDRRKRDEVFEILEAAEIQKAFEAEQIVSCGRRLRVVLRRMRRLACSPSWQRG